MTETILREWIELRIKQVEEELRHLHDWQRALVDSSHHAQQPEQAPATPVEEESEPEHVELLPDDLQPITLEKVRDAAAATVGFFDAGEVAHKVKRSRVIVMPHLSELAGRGILERGTDEHLGRFRYNREDVPEHPGSAKGPLSPERMAGVGADAPKRGDVVAHTRVIGRSGRPGLDKKRTEMGQRVARKKGKRT